MNFLQPKGVIKAMVAPENSIADELLPEIELSITPSKLSGIIKVDLHRLDDEFLGYLLNEGLIDLYDPAGGHADTVIMTITKFPKYCQGIRDAYCKYKRIN